MAGGDSSGATWQRDGRCGGGVGGDGQKGLGLEPVAPLEESDRKAAKEAGDAAETSLRPRAESSTSRSEGRVRSARLPAQLAGAAHLPTCTVQEQEAPALWA